MSTSSNDEPVTSDRAVDTWSLFSAVSGSASTRISVPESLSSVWIVAPLSPYPSTASRTSPTEASPAGTTHTVPPSKSMPRLRPFQNSPTRLSRTATAESVNQSLRRPTKSTLVSPW